MLLLRATPPHFLPRASRIAYHATPTDPRKLKKNVVMFASIQANCGAQVALTSRTYAQAKKFKTMLSRTKIQWPDIRWVTTTSLTASPCPLGADLPLDTSDRNDLAFLQYTSGSTAAPKVGTHPGGWSCLLHCHSQRLVAWLSCCFSFLVVAFVFRTFCCFFVSVSCRRASW